MTITLLGTVEDCRQAQAIITAADGIEVDRASDLVGVADGSGRYRVYLSVTVGA